jgi:hypothetical protein
LTPNIIHLDSALMKFEIVRDVLHYRRTSISGTKKAHMIFPLRHFFPLKVVKQHGKVKSNSMETCLAYTLFPAKGCPAYRSSPVVLLILSIEILN